MKNELVSVIIPIYNVELYLKECLDSIVNQTYKNLEIILVDDGSPDNCGKICDNYAEKDNRIKVIHKENGGLSSARNAGLDIATGEYISFIDSDDYVAENFIETLYLTLINTEADIVQCSYTRDSFNETLHDEKVLSNIQAIINLNDIKKNLEYVIVWNKLYKRKLFKKNRFPLNKICEDTFVTYKLFWNAKNITIISNVLYYWRNTPESITGKKFNVKRYDSLEGVEGEIEYFKERLPDKLFFTSCVLYQHMLKFCYLMTYTYIEENKKENLGILSKKIKGNLKNFLKYSDDTFDLKFKVVFFSIFPNLFAIFTKWFDEVK